MIAKRIPANEENAREIVESLLLKECGKGLTVVDRQHLASRIVTRLTEVNLIAEDE
jgi:hypothetical protein